MLVAKAFTDFIEQYKFRGKGPLCVALVVTQHARNRGLPLDPDTLLTDRGGQVEGLGKASVQAILKRHGIERVLAAEGGRTSRGSIDNMRSYVGLLNSSQNVDLDEVEKFWIGQVQLFFAGHPFRINLDESKGLRFVVHNVLLQALDRQKEAGGTQYAGAVLQHLVGAKLDCALGKDEFEHNSFSTSDAQSGRAGDFLVGDVAIHVTTTPTEAVIARCADNLEHALRPVLVTLPHRVEMAAGLADNAQIADRIDIFEAEQFVALNLYEIGRFRAEGRRTAVADLVERYNDIVDLVETDPSLKI
jgi:hypothetical protein